MNFDFDLWSSLLGLATALIPILVPAINRKIDKVTTRKSVQIGFKVVEALEDNKLTTEEVESLLELARK